MKKYDVVVVGSGSGMIVLEEAVESNLKAALIDRGPLGGTCLNLGCIPSKMLIFPADRIVEIQESSKLGIAATVKGIDFKSIMGHMRNTVRKSYEHVRTAITQSKDFDYYDDTGRFIRDYAIMVNGQEVRGDKIFIASGSRPLIPQISGLDAVDYLTNETVLELEERPSSLIIIGGGYVGVEYGHFFAAMGTRVTLLEMTDRLTSAEEPEISRLLQTQLGRRLDIQTNVRAEQIKKDDNGHIRVIAVDSITGEGKEFSAQRIMIASGRRSNADLLQVGNSGVATDKKGYIKTNEYLETSKKNIFAIGDANGKQMFTHTANKEAALVAHNALYGARLKMDYNTVPHAVYSCPQIASVGLTETAARENHDILVGRAEYTDVAKGEAMVEEAGFAKAILEKKSGRILGFHIIGPYAPMLIQEVVSAMTSGGHTGEISEVIHIHPALSELIPATLNNAGES